jgi:hypothetical protein
VGRSFNPDARIVYGRILTVRLDLSQFEADSGLDLIVGGGFEEGIEN